MTDDIVERLRAWESGAVDRPKLYDEAADEIERLRAEIERLVVWSSDSHVTELIGQLAEIHDELGPYTSVAEAMRPLVDRIEDVEKQREDLLAEIERLRAEIERLRDEA